MAKRPLDFTGRDHIHLIVVDMKASIDFYTTVLGFYYVRGIKEMAWLTRDTLLLTISPGEPPDERTTYFGWSVGGFDELTRCHEDLASRLVCLGPAPDRDEDREYFFLFDPDGYPIAFTCDDLGV